MAMVMVVVGVPMVMAVPVFVTTVAVTSMVMTVPVFVTTVAVASMEMTVPLFVTNQSGATMVLTVTVTVPVTGEGTRWRKQQSARHSDRKAKVAEHRGVSS